MTERIPACRWVASDQPRAVKGHHEPDCPGDCPGCAPCEHPHCVICRREHCAATCAGCLNDTREALHEIREMCRLLRPEVLSRGYNGDRDGTVLGGDAMVMVAMRYGDQTGARAGDHQHERINDPTPPIVVLVGWEDVWRDHLDHPTELTATIGRAVDYLDLQMTYMAGVLDVPFDEFARDLRDLAGRLRNILHDQNLGDVANVGCFECGGELERRLGERGFEDHWTCQRCRRRYTYAEYNFALRAALEETA